MALGGDGLVAQAVPLTGREIGGAGERLERQTSWFLVLGTGRVLLPAGFSCHQGVDWQVMEVDATTEPPSSPHPSAGTAGTMGSTETQCREELGAWWSHGRDHH